MERLKPLRCDNTTVLKRTQSLRWTEGREGESEWLDRAGAPTRKTEEAVDRR